MTDFMFTVGGLIGNVISSSRIGAMLFPGVYNIAQIPIDSFLKIDHESRATPTKYPVETGANYSDHIVIEPAKVTVSGLVSDVELKPFTYGITPELGEVATFMNNILNSKSSAIWNQLKAVQTSRTLFTLEAGIETYDNMCITSLRVSQDKNTSGSLRFTAVCEEILTIDFEQRENNLATSVPEDVGGKSTTDIAKNNGDTHTRMLKPKKSGELKAEQGSTFLYRQIIGE